MDTQEALWTHARNYCITKESTLLHYRMILVGVSQQREPLGILI